MNGLSKGFTMRSKSEKAMNTEQALALVLVLLNVQQVAEVLNASVRSVWRMHDSAGMPKAVRPGGTMVRWRKSDITKWIEWDCCDRKTFEDRLDMEHGAELNRAVRSQKGV